MKIDMSDKLVEILSKIQESVAAAGDFAVSQLTDIAQQYILFGIVYNTAVSLFLLCMSVGIAYTAYRLYKLPFEQDPNWRSYSDKNENLKLAGYMFCAFGFVFSFFGFVITIQETFLVWFAPKIWLLKEIAVLLKHAS